MTGRPAFDAALEIDLAGEVIHWRGPSPFYFVPVPEDPSAAIRAIASELSYGWGVIPVTVELGGTTFSTALIPKDGRYLVPLKDAIRLPMGLGEGDAVKLRLWLGR